MSYDLELRRDLAKATVAKNLVLARNASNMTQGQLAEAAGISRATIAQMESGSTDPRLSSLVDLATAMGISPILLLLGEAELRALARIEGETPRELVSKDQIDEMRRLMASGLGKQRIQAATLGATVARDAGLSAVGAAIGTALIPGIGTVIGALIGTLVGNRNR